MAPFRWRFGAAGLLLAAVLALGRPAQALESRPQGIGPAPPAPTGILINLPARTLYWYVDGALVKSFPVGVGRTTDHTPTGAYQIQNKQVNPTWYPPWGGAPVPPGPANPLGTRWMAFDGSYGIHGNNLPSSIGGVVSAGCIRMFNADVEWLYRQVSVGTPVNVVYETAQLQTGSDGHSYLAVYPDVYGYGGKSPGAVLTAAGWDANTVTPNVPGLYRLDAEALVNGGPVPAVMYQGRPYLAARALAARLGATVAWHADAWAVALDGQQIATVLRSGTGYVEAEAAAAVLGVGYSWNAETSTVVLTGMPVFLNGHLLNREGVTLDGEVYLPVRAVGEASGAVVGWENGLRQALVGGRAVTSVLRGGRAFAPAAELSAVLGLRLREESGGTYLGD